MYDYFENVKEDVKEYIKENKIKVTAANRDEIEQQLYDDLFIEDSVTGNASGSYYCNSYKAEQAIVGNLDLLKEALIEFGCDSVDVLEKGAEWCDVTIRCYLLGQALSEAINEILGEV